MVEAFRSFARMDTAKRVAQRQQNGQVVPNGIAMTAVDHVHQNWALQTRDDSSFSLIGAENEHFFECDQ